MPGLFNGCYAYDIFDHYPNATSSGLNPMTLTTLTGQTWWQMDSGPPHHANFMEHFYNADVADDYSRAFSMVGEITTTEPGVVALLDNVAADCRIIIDQRTSTGGIAFRATRTSTDWEGFYTDYLPASHHLRIIKREAGSESVVADVGSAPDGWDHLEVRTLGSAIEVYFSGTVVLSYTDSWHVSARGCGIVSGTDTNSTYQYTTVQDFYVKPVLVPSVCGPMDICFIIDETGSMGGTLDSIQSGLESVMDDIEYASGGDYRLALIAVQDPIIVAENFAPGNRVAVTAAINALSAAGGSGSPEITDEALHTAITNRSAAGQPPIPYSYYWHGVPTNASQQGDFSVPWRPAALKVIVITTDNPPSGYDDLCQWSVDMPRASSYAVLASAADIHIAAIPAPDSGLMRGLSYSMHDYADITHGVYSMASGTGQGAAEAVREAIFSCVGFVNRPAVIAQLAG